MNVEYAGAFCTAAVVGWLIAFVWFPASRKAKRHFLRFFIISVVGIAGIMVVSLALAGAVGAVVAVLGVIFGGAISAQVRAYIILKINKRMW